MLDNLPIFKSLSASAANAETLVKRAPSSGFIMELTAAHSNPLGDLELKLALSGPPPSDTLILRSTETSELFYASPLETSAHMAQIDWRVPLIPG